MLEEPFAPPRGSPTSDAWELPFVVRLLYLPDGRLDRGTFWASWLLCCGASLGAAGVVARVWDEVYDLAFLALVLHLSWVGLMLQIKRWHDLDKSGVWVLVHFVAYVGWLYGLASLLQRGVARRNAYGAEPTPDDRLGLRPATPEELEEMRFMGRDTLHPDLTD